MTPEQKHAKQREWYRRNREKILAIRREYYEQNKDAVKARRAEYYSRNRDSILEYAREYNLRNSARRSEYQRTYKDRNRETLRVKQRARAHGPAVDLDWAALWDRQEGCCYLCGAALGDMDRTKIHIDHDHSCCPPLRSCGTCRRGIACSDCNSAIGFAHDDPDRLRRIADALESAQQAVRQRMAVAQPDQLALEIPA